VTVILLTFARFHVKKMKAAFKETIFVPIFSGMKEITNVMREIISAINYVRSQDAALFVAVSQDMMKAWVTTVITSISALRSAKTTTVQEYACLIPQYHMKDIIAVKKGAFISAHYAESVNACSQIISMTIILS